MLIPTCLIKFMELILAISCLVLHHYSFDLTDMPTLMLCSGTYVGYVIVFSGEIIGEMIFSPLDLVQDIYYGIIGVGLFCTCGCLTLAARLKDSTYPRTGDPISGLIVGTLSIISAVVIFLDLSLAYLDSEEFDDEGSEVVSAVADPYVDSWWSASGACLYVGSGYLTLQAWRDIPECPRRIMAQATAACALAVSAILLVDALLALCTANRDEDSKL